MLLPRIATRFMVRSSSLQFVLGLRTSLVYVVIPMPKAGDLALVGKVMPSGRAMQGALAILACGSTILWFALWQNRSLGETPSADLSALLFCMGSGWIAARFIARFRTRLSIETSAVYRLLQDQPDDVIWIFAYPINWQVAGLRLEVG